ncbi:MAG TPA: hypothetical protein PLJ47_08620 [Candidatus Hydrogenedentes bacterium]|nr:hypothetical protein [Candidatus Hydrogenedentota bacterium]HRK34645.1 hypothetical protein [Candidatus Hydrogenedentota bacterium]
MNRLLQASAMLGMLALGFGLGQWNREASADANVVRATRFELVNSDGRVMGMFGSVNGKTAQLEIHDEAGNPRVHMGIRDSNGEPEFMLNGKDGKKRAWLSLTSVGGANLMLIDNGERARVNMLTTPEGDPFLHMLDANEVGRATCGIRNDGTPVLELHDADGNVRAAFRVEKDGNGSLSYPEPPVIEPPKEGEAP